MRNCVFHLTIGSSDVTQTSISLLEVTWQDSSAHLQTRCSSSTTAVWTTTFICSCKTTIESRTLAACRLASTYTAPGRRWARLQGQLLLLLLPAGLRVLFYSMVYSPKMGLRPAGSTRCPINVKFPRAKSHVYRGENVGIELQKLSKFRILARNLYLRGDSFAIFLRNSQHSYASFKGTLRRRIAYIYFWSTWKVYTMKYFSIAKLFLIALLRNNYLSPKCIGD